MESDIKITADEYFDDSKFILNDNDKKRIQKNINLLKEANLPYIEYMRTVPIDSITQVKSKEEILNRMLIDYLLAVFSIYSCEDNTEVLNNLLNRFETKMNIRNLMSLVEKYTLNDILENKISSEEKEKLALRLEKIPVYLWSLGFISKPSSKDKSLPFKVIC